MRTLTLVSLIALAGGELAAPSHAQLKPGTFLAAVPGTARGIYVVDRFANTGVRLTIVGAPSWGSATPFRTFIEDRNNFLVLAANTGAHVFRVTRSNNTWTASLLTTGTVPPDWGWDVARIGGWIYLCRSSGGSTAIDGQIWRLPANGGTAALYVRLGPSVVGMPRMVAVGSALHVFMWDASSTAGGAHVSVNTAVTPPIVTRRGRLPFSKWTCRRLAVLPTQACLDPASGLIVIGGRVGDVLWRTTAGVQVRHEMVQQPPCAPPPTQLGFSLGLNTDTGAPLYGDGDRSLSTLR